jgi:hypothetical protein
VFLIIINLIYLGRNVLTHKNGKIIIKAIRDYNISEIKKITDENE